MEITATQFKARCLALLDEVSESGAELTITKHGRPVAVVRALDEDASLRGSATQLVSDEELIAPIAVEWDAQRSRA